MRKVLAVMVSLSLFSKLLVAQDVDVSALAGEYWYGLYFSGQKAGYMMQNIEALEDGGTRLTEHAAFRISMGGARQDMTIRGEKRYDPSGDLLRMVQEVEDSTGAKTFELELEGDTALLRTVMAGQTSERPIPAPAESLGDALKQVRLVTGAPSVGDTVTFSSFEPLYGIELTGTSRIEAVEQRMIQGADTTVYTVVTVLDQMPLETVSHVTAEGVTLEDVAAGILTMRLEPKEIARDVDYENDVIVSNAALLDGPLENPRGRDTLELVLDGPISDAQLFSDNRQTMRRDNGRVVFEARRVRPDSLDPVALPVEDGPARQWLEPSQFVQSDHPELRAKADSIVGGETDSFAVSTLLCNWVYENVRTTFSAQLSNSLDVLRELEGDCTEHSILFIGLARAAGLPAREVAGLVYVGQPEPGFYFHQWAKVWVGEWIDVDPTFNQPIADATHIKLSEGDLLEQTALLPVIGRITVEVPETASP